MGWKDGKTFFHNFYSGAGCGACWGAWYNHLSDLPSQDSIFHLVGTGTPYRDQGRKGTLWESMGSTDFLAKYWAQCVRFAKSPRTVRARKGTHEVPQNIFSCCLKARKSRTEKITSFSPVIYGSSRASLKIFSGLYFVLIKWHSPMIVLQKKTKNKTTTTTKNSRQPRLYLKRTTVELWGTKTANRTWMF